MNVLLKVDTILDVQKQQLILLHRIASASRATAQVVDLQDFLPKPLNPADLQELEKKLGRLSLQEQPGKLSISSAVGLHVGFSQHSVVYRKCAVLPSVE